MENRKPSPVGAPVSSSSTTMPVGARHGRDCMWWRLPSGPVSTKGAGGAPSSGRPVSWATLRSAQRSHSGVSLR